MCCFKSVELILVCYEVTNRICFSIIKVRCEVFYNILKDIKINESRKYVILNKSCLCVICLTGINSCAL